MMNQKIIVVGATGFVGRAVIGQLRSNGFDNLLAIARNQSRLDQVYGGKTEIIAADAEREIIPMRRGDILINATSPTERVGQALLPACIRNDVGYLDAAAGQGWMAEVYATAKSASSVVCAGLGMESAPGEFLARKAMSMLADIAILEISYQVDGRSLTNGTLKTYVEILKQKEYFTLVEGKRKLIRIGKKHWKTTDGVVISEIPSGEAVALEDDFAGTLLVGFQTSRVEAIFLPHIIIPIRFLVQRHPLVARLLSLCLGALPLSENFQRQRFSVSACARSRVGQRMELSGTATNAYEFSGKMLAEVALRIAYDNGLKGVISGGRILTDETLKRCGFNMKQPEEQDCTPTLS